MDFVVLWCPFLCLLKRFLGISNNYIGTKFKYIQTKITYVAHLANAKSSLKPLWPTQRTVYFLCILLLPGIPMCLVFLKEKMCNMWKFCHCLKIAAKVKTCTNLLSLLAPYCVSRHTPSKCLHSPSATDQQNNALKSGVAWHRQRPSMSNFIQTCAPYQEPYDTILIIKAALLGPTAHQSHRYGSQADRQNLSQS